jgi:sec-independent protein translocase protein TatC
MPRGCSLRQQKTKQRCRVGHVGGVTAGTVHATRFEGTTVMSIGRTKYPDPDDYFAETRMSFGDHLEELRLHLWRAIGGFMIALVFGFFVGKPLLHFIRVPVESELQKYWDRYYQNKNRKIQEDLRNQVIPKGQPVTMELKFRKREFQKVFGKDATDKKPALDIIPQLQPLLHQLGIEDWVDPQDPAASDSWITVQAEITNPVQVFSEGKMLEPLIGRGVALTTLNAQEGLLVWFKVSMVAGFVLASPWIFYQIWSFIAAGLYPQEKRYVNVFLPFSIGLFLAGVLVCQFFVIPKAVGALLWFNEWLQLEPDFRLNEWLSFAILMPLVFGLSFQTPLVMLFLERVGILTVDSFRRKRGIAWFLLALFAAVVLPSVDVASMLFLWLPLGLLYELGIIMCVLWPRPPAFDMDVSESDELIEV